MHRESFFLASKRAPVTYEQDAGGRIVAALAPGGTANVLADQASYLGVSWIACAMSAEDIQAANGSPHGLDIAVTSERPITLHLTQHDRSVFESMQEVMTSDLLWCSNNYLWDSWTGPRFDTHTRQVWADFQRFSATMADVILARSATAPAPVYVIHDYQMVCVPALLRQERPASPMLLFIHIPWPAPDYWRMMPRYLRDEVLRGMLGASTVGFFARRWARNFLACVADALPAARVDVDAGTVAWQGRTVRVEAMPLGYSPQALAFRKPEMSEDLRAWLGDRPLVLHSGRTDPIKNAACAVDAFVLAASRGGAPARVRMARMLVRTNPNRLYVDANSQYLARVEAAVARANQTLGADTVRMVCENQVDATFGSIERADVLMFNSTVDGQNLTVFESALVNRRDAAVILSERAGAAEALGEVCTLVNPFDVAEQADALEQALAMPAAARAEAAARRRAVAARYDLPRWVDQQLASLGVAGRGQVGEER